MNIMVGLVLHLKQILHGRRWYLQYFGGLDPQHDSEWLRDKYVYVYIYMHDTEVFLNVYYLYLI